MRRTATALLFLHAFAAFQPAVVECVLVQVQPPPPPPPPPGVFSFSSSSGPSRLSSMNIAFDLPDLTTTLDTDEGSTQIVAYRSVDNDRILSSAADGSVQQSRLHWVSIGSPRLIRTPPAAAPGNRSGGVRLFHFTHHGFTTYVEMLSTAQRRALADTARTKYRVGDVADGQVLDLIMSGFRCGLVFYDGAGNRYQLDGKVSDFSNYPLRLDFHVPPARNADRKLYQDLIEDPEMDLQFNCTVESSGKLKKVNTLTISADQQMALGLEEELFGPAGKNGRDEVYVTRDQMTQLTADLHTTLNIFEDYEMSEHQFSQAFIDGLIDQSVSSQFSHVSIDAALESLSKFGFDIGADLQPDVFKRNAGSILKIQTQDSKTRIVLDEEKYDEFQETHTNSGRERRGFLFFRRSADWSRSNSRRSDSGSAKLEDELRELNTASQDEAQWEVEGTRIVPKSLNVARMTRSKLRKTLTFSRVRLQTYDVPFRKDFSMYTVRAAATGPTPEEELSTRVTQLQNASQLIRAQMEGASSGMRRCRVCFNETEGADDQCGGVRRTCSSWTDSIGAKWTLPFQDRTDNRQGGCTYQWAVQCQA